MRFDDGRHIPQRVQQGQEALVPIAVAPLIPIFVQAVFVLDVHDVWVKLANLLGHRAPPVGHGHVDNRDNTVALAVGMADNQYLALGVVLLDEFPGFLTEGGYSAKPGGITANHHDRVWH